MCQPKEIQNRLIQPLDGRWEALKYVDITKLLEQCPSQNCVKCFPEVYKAIVDFRRAMAMLKTLVSQQAGLMNNFLNFTSAGYAKA